MKTRVISLLLFVFLFLSMSRLTAQQFSFGMQYACEPEDAYAKVTLPATALTDIITESGEAISPADVCLAEKPAGMLSGFQADYDGDGKEEMWLLYHTGPEKTGCNVTLVITAAGGGKYQLMDLLALPPGEVLIRPIITLDKGVQMYLENRSTPADGNPITKGSILWYTQTALIVLTSWTQTSGIRDGRYVAEIVDAAWTDSNFDKIKELVVRYSIHETGGGTPTSKNMVDQYILTLDFLPNHLRYGVYDSAGYTKIQDADTKAKISRTKLNRDETRTEGIIGMREALSVNPFMTWSRVRLGEFLLHDGKYADAEFTLLQAATFDPTHNKTYRILGDTYLRLNDLQKALAAYNRYLELGPESNYYKNKVKGNIKNITVPRRRR